MKREYYNTHKSLWRKYYNTRRRKAPVYATWRSMLTRCGYIEGAKPHEVKRYIGRNIKVCEEWLEYEAFEKWALSHGWKRGLQIDRIDNDGNYEPSNCRFVTAKQNCANRGNCLSVVYRGKRMKLVEAYALSGCCLDYKLVNNRVRNLGWTAEEAFGETERKHK